jgi:hypothetical protein
VAATFGDAASVRMEEAVFRSLTMSGASRLRLSSDIEAIRLPVVPGRARLVR